MISIPGWWRTFEFMIDIAFAFADTVFVQILDGNGTNDRRSDRKQMHEHQSSKS
jgi:hypothetical protein